MTATSVVTDLTKAFFEEIFAKHSLAQHLRVLEVGCGKGALALLLQEHHTVVAIDPSEEAIQAARQSGVKDARHCGILDLKPVQRGEGGEGAGEEQLQVEQRSFDVVLFTLSLHHIGEVPRVLSMVRDQLLREGGLLIVQELAREAIDLPTAEWYYGLLDLLVAAKAIDAKDAIQGPSHSHHHHHHGDGEKKEEKNEAAAEHSHGSSSSSHEQHSHHQHSHHQHQHEHGHQHHQHAHHQHSHHQHHEAQATELPAEEHKPKDALERWHNQFQHHRHGIHGIEELHLGRDLVQEVKAAFTVNEVEMVKEPFLFRFISNLIDKKGASGDCSHTARSLATSLHQWEQRMIAVQAIVPLGFTLIVRS